jgi:hypothetical protein
VGSTGEPSQLSVVLFEGFELLDVCGPLEMFGLLTDRFSINLVGPDAGAVKSATGPQIVADRSYGEAPPPDILLVPGGIGTRRLVQDRKFLAWLSDWAASARYVRIGDWDGFVNQCQALRRQLGQPTGRWSKHCLLAAIQLTVRARNWPAAQTKTALLSVAADPATRSPMRLAEAGPWWNEPGPVTAASDIAPADLAAMEADLADAGGLRPLLQRQAREELGAEGLPATRATVTQRAHALLNTRLDNGPGAAACSATARRAP